MLLTEVPADAHSLYSLRQSPTAEALTAGALCVVVAGTMVRWPDVEMQTPPGYWCAGLQKNDVDSCEADADAVVDAVMVMTECVDAGEPVSARATVAMSMAVAMLDFMVPARGRQ